MRFAFFYVSFSGKGIGKWKEKRDGSSSYEAKVNGAYLSFLILRLCMGIVQP